MLLSVQFQRDGSASDRVGVVFPTATENGLTYVQCDSAGSSRYIQGELGYSTLRYRYGQCLVCVTGLWVGADYESAQAGAQSCSR